MAECLKQTAPNRWACVRKNDLSPTVFVFTRGMIKVRVSDEDRNCLDGV